MINDEVQEGALDTDLDIDTTDPHTNDDVDVGDPRTQLEIPITDEDSGTDVLYGQQYDFVVDEIPTNNDALERIQDIPAPIDLQNIGEPRISQAELSTVDKNDKIGMNKSTDDEGQIGGVNDEQIGGAKAHTRVHFVRDPYLLRDRKPKQSVLHTECEVI